MKTGLLKNNHIIRLLSFLLPCCCMLLVFALCGKYPFGTESLESDAGAQYYPFLLLLRRTLRSGGSLLYTWRAGFGTNFWALIAYYCVNIWNLIAVLLPESLIQGFLTVSVCMRLGIAGLSFALLLQTCKKQPDTSVAVFASLYGLSAWFVCNWFQLIWLDTAALTPLVLAGVIRLVRERDARLYPLMLFLSLICNPYMSYITCCMTVLCWIALLIILRKPRHTLRKETLRFAGCSVLAAGMAVVFLLPMAFALRQTASYGAVSPDMFSVDTGFQAMFGRMVSFAYPVQHIGLPNISCGMLAVFLCTGYLTEKQIALRERLVTGILLFFLLFSLWYPPLNYIWHGFHIPNGFIHRFAYLVPLVLLFMGWRFTDAWQTAAQSGHGKKLLRLLMMLATSCSVMVSAIIYDTTDIVIVCAVFVLLYALLYFGYLKLRQLRKVFPLLLTVFALTEAVYGAKLIVDFITNEYQAADLRSQTKITAAAEAVQSDAAEKQQLLYRTALTQGNGHNPELFYDLKFGGNLYSSLIPGDLCFYAEQLGFDSGYGANFIFYQDVSPLSVLLTDLQYVIAPDGAAPPGALYEQLSGTDAYAFRYAGFPGFCISETALPETGSDFFAFQEALYHSLTDSDETLFEMLPGTSETTDAELSGTPGEWQYCQTGSNDRTALVYTYTADADGWYLYQFMFDDTLAAALKRYDIAADGESSETKVFMPEEIYPASGKLHQIGQLHAGQTVSITLILPADTEGSLCVQAARFNEAALADITADLGSRAMELTEIADTSLCGTVTADAAHPVLYLAVPYDDGWRATADGQPAEIEAVFGAMCGIRLQPGTHEIEMRFCPRGYVSGCTVSMLSAAGYILLLVLHHKRKTESGGARHAHN